MVRLVALLRPVPLLVGTLLALSLIVLATMYGSTSPSGGEPANRDVSVGTTRHPSTGS